MSGLTAATLLEVWERNQGLSPAEQSLVLSHIAWPDAPIADLASLPLGTRDHLLFRLREATFGPTLPSLAVCPACQQAVEFDLDVRALGAEAHVETDVETHEIEQDGWRVHFRLPNTLDLLEAGDDEETAAGRMFATCVLSATRADETVAMESLPPTIAEAVASRMEEIDRLADIVLNLTCAACGHAWEVLFDIVAYLVREIDTWARSLMGEVDALARGYGWTEPQVLALGPKRRRYYLDLLTP